MAGVESCEELSDVSCEASTSASAVQTIPSAFQNIAHYKVGGTKNNNIALSILFFICKDMRPFHVVEGEGFLRLMREVAPLYKVPSSEYFKKMLTEKYEVTKLLYKKQIEQVSYLSVTMDIWTETMAEKSFLGVRIHFIKGIELINCAIATKQLYERHTSKNISDSLKGIFIEWDIPISKVRCIVTDNAANMIAAVRDICSDKNHLPCFAHTLHLIVQNGLKDLIVEEVIGKIRVIVKWVKNSVINSDEKRCS